MNSTNTTYTRRRFSPPVANTELNQLHRGRSADRWWLALVGLASFTAVLTTAAAAAPEVDNWPQWRGPLNTGVAPTANPPLTWSETNNIKWKVKIPGFGLATPIIWGQQIFIQTAIPTGRKAEGAEKPNPSATAEAPAASARANAGTQRSGPAGGRRGGMMSSEKPNEYYQFALICLDRQTGKTMWQKVAREELPHEGFRPGDASFASTSPVTDGNLVFAYFGSRGLHCYDRQGNLKWEKYFGKMRVKLGYGEGSSPALFGNTIVINWDHEDDSFIVALDKESGKELWRQSREGEKTSWATPLIVQHEGKAQVITDASNKIRSYDLATGSLAWECKGLTANVIPSPVAADGVVYCMSGFRGNALLAIRLGRTGDLTGTDAIAWSYNRSTPYVPSPLLYDGKLYFFAVNNGTLSCFDAKSGRPLINAERLEAIPNVYSPPAGANGRVYLVGREGAAVVIKLSDKLEVLATNHLEDHFEASPVMVGRELFLRGHQYLYCICEK